MEISLVAAGMLGEGLDRFRQLGRVGMGLAAVNLETGFNVTVPEFVARQHPQDGLLKNEFRILLQLLFRSSLLQTTGIASVPSIQFVLPLLSRKVDLYRTQHTTKLSRFFIARKATILFRYLFCVNDNDVVTAITVWSIRWFVLALQ